MHYHIALHRAFDLADTERCATAGESPRHVMWALSQKLGAKVHVPEGDRILPIDRLRAKLLGTPDLWAMARRLSSQLTSNDLIYCTGEVTGIPIAALCCNSKDSPTVVIYIHDAYRLRTQLLLKVIPFAQRSVHFITNTSAQVEFLKEYFGLRDHQVSLLLEQTDTQFFAPGSVSPKKQRKMIASVGLERRDYQLLAAAAGDMDVDIRITGFSADVRRNMATFPATPPANMSTHTLAWIDLLQLYRDADVVVLALMKSMVTSGVTALLEAMACARPVIVTRTEGLVDYLKPLDTVYTVEPGDLKGLRKTIQYVLDHPDEAKTIAHGGHQYVHRFHSSDDYVESLAQLLIDQKYTCSHKV